MISVALCTYNGAQYIEKQLNSILRQSQHVDEIVVCDDGSTDNTLGIIEQLSKETEIVFRLFRNDGRLGSSRNFSKAIEQCHGDIVFLSDQDDIWKRDKVQPIVDWFDSNPQKSAVFSDADLIDENDNLITEKSLWDCIGFTPKAQKSFNEGFGIELFAQENRATGATMAVRRKFAVASNFLDICNDNILHDGALALLALEEDALGFIPQKLTEYRCHGNQSIGIGATIKIPLSDDFLATSNMSTIWSAQPLPDRVAGRMHFIALRYRMMHQRVGLFRILREACNYRTHYGKYWKTIIRHDISSWNKNLNYQ